MREQLYAMLQDWSLRMSQRVTMSDAQIEARQKSGGATGVVLGVFDETDAPTDQTARYRGKIPPRETS